MFNLYRRRSLSLSALPSFVLNIKTILLSVPPHSHPFRITKQTANKRTMTIKATTMKIRIVMSCMITTDKSNEEK